MAHIASGTGDGLFRLGQGRAGDGGGHGRQSVGSSLAGKKTPASVAQGGRKPRPALLRGSASSARRALVNIGVRGFLAERPLFGRRPPALRESRPRMVQGAEHRAPIDPGHYPGLKGTSRVPKSPKTRD